MNLSDKKSFFTAIPGKADPLLLRRAFQNTLLESFKTYLAAVQSAAKVDLSLQLQKIASLQPERRFSPLLYARYTQLKSAYEQKSLDQIFDSIQLFNSLSVLDFYAEERTYSPALEKEWERPFLQEIRNTPYLDPEFKPQNRDTKILPLIHWAPCDFPPPLFFKSVELLKQLDPLLFQELEAYVSSVKFYASQTLFSVTSPRYFGAIYMHVPEEKEQLLFFLETLVHETSHLHLFAIMNLNPLLLNIETDLYVSPIRKDKRPMVGIFHAVFALSRMVRILSLYCQAFPNDLNAKIQLTDRINSLQNGITVISSHAKMSREGLELFDTLTDSLCKTNSSSGKIS